MVVKPIKRYGQNFLKNNQILEDIANLITVKSNDLIIEIGPGMGALTEYLARKKCNLLCYEIDSRMHEYLDKYESDKIHFIYDDFLKHDLQKDIDLSPFGNIYVVANIPYYITSPIILKLIQSGVDFKNIVLLVQKEFAERLGAEAGNKEYNAFTLYVDYFYHVKLMFLVSKNNFFPVPKVDSAVVMLEKKPKTKVIDEESYFTFIKEAFQNKRKTLKNNMQNYDWDKIQSSLDKMGYLENVRAEEISKEDFKTLWNFYNN